MDTPNSFAPMDGMKPAPEETAVESDTQGTTEDPGQPLLSPRSVVNHIDPPEHGVYGSGYVRPHHSESLSGSPHIQSNTRLLDDTYEGSKEVLAGDFWDEERANDLTNDMTAPLHYDPNGFGFSAFSEANRWAVFDQPQPGHDTIKDLTQPVQNKPNVSAATAALHPVGGFADDPAEGSAISFRQIFAIPEQTFFMWPTGPSRNQNSGQLIRDVKAPGPDDFSDVAMVIRMVQSHREFRGDYRWSAVDALIKWLFKDLEWRLNALLVIDNDNFAAEDAAYIPRGEQLPALMNSKGRGPKGLEQLTRWCKKARQRHLGFRRIGDYIRRLQHFDLERELSLHEMMELVVEINQRVQGKPFPNAGLWGAPSGQAALHPAANFVSKNSSMSDRNAQKPSSLHQAMGSPSQPGGPQISRYSTFNEPTYGNQQHAPQFHEPSALQFLSALQRPGRTKSKQVFRDEQTSFGSALGQAPTLKTLKDKTNLPPRSRRPKGGSLHSIGQSMVSTPSVPTMAAQSNPSSKRKADHEILNDHDQERKMRHDLPALPQVQSPQRPVDQPVDDATHTSLNDQSAVGTSSALLMADQEVPDHLRLPTDNVPNNMYDLLSYVELLCSHICDAATMQGVKRQYAPLPLDTKKDARNKWLYDQILEANIGFAPLFRTLDLPDDDNFSLFARCIRFARSDAQQHTHWRVHPAHVNVIITLTNAYGLELLETRTSVDPDTVHTEEDFELLLSIRFIQRYPHLHPVATDIPKIKDWLVRYPCHMLDQIVTEQDIRTFPLIFGAFTEYCRRQWPNWKGGLGQRELFGDDKEAGHDTHLEGLVERCLQMERELDPEQSDRATEPSPPSDPDLLME